MRCPRVRRTRGPRFGDALAHDKAEPPSRSSVADSVSSAGTEIMSPRTRTKPADLTSLDFLSPTTRRHAGDYARVSVPDENLAIARAMCARPAEPTRSHTNKADDPVF